VPLDRTSSGVISLCWTRPELRADPATVRLHGVVVSVAAALIGSLTTGCNPIGGSCSTAQEGPSRAITLAPGGTVRTVPLHATMSVTVPRVGFGPVVSTSPHVLGVLVQPRINFGRRVYFFVANHTGTATLQTREARTGQQWTARVTVPCHI
jgi:hypothetical protein